MAAPVESDVDAEMWTNPRHCSHANVDNEYVALKAESGPRQCGNTRRGPHQSPTREVVAVHQPTQNHPQRALELLRMAARDDFTSAIRLVYFINLARQYGVHSDDILDAISAGAE